MLQLIRGRGIHPTFLPQHAPADLSSGSGLRKGRILVVEDDYFVALELEHRLREADFEVVGIAATAEEALELAVSEKPDLAIMDVRLASARDGVDAAIELFLRLGVPSVFATAHADETTRRRAEKAEPIGWIQKPYAWEPLLELLQTALARKC